ncbi:MAG: thioredoxin [Acidimicrobiia bacterium]|jgi:thioredoxin 1|nr:thioredoxin [Acidimicrobiia bacterium]MBP8179402.1 thioredoxin [Acidimicrobiia bacterium]
MANGVQVLDTATFDEVIGAADKPVLVDFWAEWCGPCRMIAPVLENVAANHGSKITISKLNVDENPDIAQRFSVMSIPTLIVFKDGKEDKRLIGSKPEAALLADLAEYIG